MLKHLLSFGTMAILACEGLVTLHAADQAEKTAEKKTAVEKNTNADGPLVQMAILLDNSGSMSGLINQARQHVWKIVNEFATVRRDGKEPRLQVALYKYANGKPERLTEFTDDLDKVSEMLFATQIEGGSEYCGQVIQAAVDELDWSKVDADLRCIFIAGNEPFTQGPVDYAGACKNAIAKGITVSTIFCGDEREGMNGKWQDGALLADGTFLNIDQNQAVVVVKAPQDKKIAELSAKLNTTYIAFGSKEQQEAVVTNQVAQDANALKLNTAAAAGRAMTKASNQYVCRWDLIDACKLGEVKLTELKKEELPKELQKLTTEELQKYVDDKQKERDKIREEIQDLSKERTTYVAAEQKKLAQANPSANTLDAAIIQSVREQATRKNYTIEKK
jgi:hypothetical protein